MDAGSWIGIVALVVCVPIGVFILYALLSRRAGNRPSAAVRLWLLAVGAAFVAGGVVAFVNLTLAGRRTVTITVLGRLSSGGRLGGEYIRTASGTYQVTRGLYSSLHAGRTYRCRVLGDYTGEPGFGNSQADLESCTPGR